MSLSFLKYYISTNCKYSSQNKSFYFPILSVFNANVLYGKFIPLSPAIVDVIWKFDVDIRSF